MGKFCFPSCCFKWCCFSSSSPPQEEAIAGPSIPSQSSPQISQPANAAPSIPIISSQPSQQPTNDGPSTSLSSSQPSQHPADAAPSTATNVDLKSSLEKFNDISKLQNLIQFIEELLKIASGEKKEKEYISVVSSYFQDGQTILESVDKHIGKLSEKKDSIDDVSAETKKVLIKLLEGAGNLHWVGAALSVVGFVLARFDQMSSNQKECLEILKDLAKLGKHILELYEQMAQKEKLEEAVECIVTRCIMCTSQLATAKFFRFLTVSVNADGLKAFQLKINRLYDGLQLWGIIDIQERLPKNAPHSQELYANPGAVGIGNAREEVIRLLDFKAKDESARVVVVHGFGGIGKTTLAEDVYSHIDLDSYKHCRVHMAQHCTKNDLKVLQEQILKGLFNQNLTLDNCDHGRGMIRSLSKQNPNHPLFLYIDNGLKSTDLKELVPADLGSWLPPNSRVLVTTRNLHETDVFNARNVQRRVYAVSPLPEREGRELLLKKVPDYNDEKNIDGLLKLCGGVPLLLELAGSQLDINSTTRNNIVLELLRNGEKVEEEDMSDRMVDFVYHRLLPPVQEAFLDIASFFFHPWSSEYVAWIVGEEEWRALENASFVKTGERGYVSVHDIVRARGKKMSEQNRITDPETLSDCLKDEEKLRNLKGIYIEEPFETPPIEINESHLKCMSNSLRVLRYEGGSQITFGEKCHNKPFKQLRYLHIPKDVADLPMEFEKLEHLVRYWGPLTKGMSLYELPPTLRYMTITDVHSSINGVAYSKITRPSSLVQLKFYNISTMERLPDGVEKLTKLEKLHVLYCLQLRELPSKIGELSNLKILDLWNPSSLEEWPSSFGDLSKLKTLNLNRCSSKLEESLPDSIRKNCKVIIK